MANRLVMVMVKLVSSAASGKQGTTSVRTKAALMLRVEGENVSIENGALLKASSHQAWSTFQDASRKFLEAKDVLIFRLEGATRPLCSVLTILGQPTNSVSVLVSQVPRDPLPTSPRARAVSESPSYQQQVEGAADLDGVLRRTEEMCRSISSVRSNGSSPPSLVSAGVDSTRSTRSLESLSPRTRTSQSSSVGQPSSVGGSSSAPHGLDECDLEVERLIQLSDSLTQHSAKGGRPSLPDAPRNVTILKNFCGGVYVIWDPVRLDESDKNNGYLVTGYSVSLNGQLVARATGAISCQVELNQLQPNRDYALAVRTCAEVCQSLPSKQVYFTTRSALDHHHQQQQQQLGAGKPLLLYRSHSARPRASYPSGSSDSGSSSSSLVPGVAHSQSMCSALPSHSKTTPPARRTTSAGSKQCSIPGRQTQLVTASRGSPPGVQPRSVSTSRGSTPGRQTRSVSTSRGSTPGRQTRSVSTSRGSTPGGQMRSVSTSRGSTPGGQTRSVSTSRGSTPGRQPRSVSTSRGTSPSERVRPVREAEDSQSNCSTASSGVFTDYASPKSTLSHSRRASTSPSPLALNSYLSSCLDTPYRTKSSASSELEGAGPMPPSRVRAQLDSAALSVSWDPVRRDKEGRSNGCYVLGYRVYVSGQRVASVDGAGSEHISVDLSPALATSCVRVDVRTRAMSGESEDASTVVYSNRSGLQELCNSPIHSICLRCETCV